MNENNIEYILITSYEYNNDSIPDIRIYGDKNIDTLIKLSIELEDYNNYNCKIYKIINFTKKETIDINEKIEKYKIEYEKEKKEKALKYEKEKEEKQYQEYLRLKVLYEL